MKRAVSFAALVFGLMLSVNAHAQKGVAPAVMEGRKVTGKVAFACNYERDLWIGQKFNLIPTYVLPNYTTHHTGDVDTVGTAAWQAWSEKHPAAPSISRASCPSATRVIELPDMVIMMRHTQTPDPKDPSKLINHTHCDIWRFENGKIAEHWS